MTSLDSARLEIEAGIVDLPSVVSGISDVVYHGLPGVSCSALKALKKSAAHFRYGQRKETKDLASGKALHALVLEPDSFKRDYVIEPENAPKRPSSAQWNAKKPSPESVAAMEFWSEWKRTNEGKIILTLEDAELLRGIASAIREHTTARKALCVEGRIEASAFSVHSETGLLTRSRFDFLPSQGEFADAIIDIKTTIDASPFGFAKEAFKWAYHMQNAFYLDNANRCGEERKRFIFVVAEKGPPYAVAVYELDARSVELGRETNERLLGLFAECVEFDSWPAYPQNAQPLSLPQYAFSTN